MILGYSLIAAGLWYHFKNPAKPDTAEVLGAAGVICLVCVMGWFAMVIF
jgi:hypothetical protein